MIAKAIIAIMLMGAVEGCGFSRDVRLILTQDENIEVRKNQIITLELKANPTTGYTWEVLEERNKGVLSLVGEAEYIPDTTAKKLVGSGGMQKYRFEALNTGEATLIFEYKRPWERKEPLEKYVVRIVVQ